MAKPRTEATGDHEPEASAEAAAPDNGSAQTPASLFDRDGRTEATGSAPSADLSSDGTSAPESGLPATVPTRQYKYNGEEFTGDDLLKRFVPNADAALDLLTAREQLRAHQRRLDEEVTERRKLAQRLEEVTAPKPEPQKPFTIDDWRGKQQAVAKELVAKGIVSEEVYEAIPDVIHMITDTAQRVFSTISDLRQFKEAVMGTWKDQLSPLVTGLQEAQFESERGQKLATIERNMDELSREAGFEGLATEEGKRQFVHYIRKINPETELLTGPEGKFVLADLFAAANRERLLSALNAAHKVSVAGNVPVSAAAGEGSGGRGGRGRAGKNDDIVKAFESQQQRGG